MCTLTCLYLCCYYTVRIIYQLDFGKIKNSLVSKTGTSVHFIRLLASAVNYEYVDSYTEKKHCPN